MVSVKMSGWVFRSVVTGPVDGEVVDVGDHGETLTVCKDPWHALKIASGYEVMACQVDCLHIDRELAFGCEASSYRINWRVDVREALVRFARWCFGRLKHPHDQRAIIEDLARHRDRAWAWIHLACMASDRLLWQLDEHEEAEVRGIMALRLERMLKETHERLELPRAFLADLEGESPGDGDR